MLKKLDDLGLRKNTLVIFSSDNGPEDIHINNAGHSGVGSPGPFRGRKRSLYEGGVRLPFIARLPGRIPAARVDSESVLAAVDFLPTICSLAGQKTPAGWQADGENVADILTGKPRPRTRPLYWEWRFNIPGYHVNRSPILALREGDWKLLMNPDRSREELYDIPRDPMELNNQAGRRPAIVQRLSEKALAWQKSLPPGPIDADAGIISLYCSISILDSPCGKSCKPFQNANDPRPRRHLCSFYEFLQLQEWPFSDVLACESRVPLNVIPSKSLIYIRASEKTAHMHLEAKSDEVLTVQEVASDLRCSRAHVYNAINGMVPGVSPLPAIHLGRRRLVRRSTLEEWKRTNERTPALLRSDHLRQR